MIDSWPKKYLGATSYIVDFFTINTKTPFCRDGDLSKDFSSTDSKIVPVVFAHGLLDSNMNHSGHGLQMASQGYMVFIPAFNDGSGPYT